MKRILVVLFVTVCLCSLLYFVYSKNAATTVRSDKLQIVASFYPLAEFARNVGGDMVEVFTVTPPGSEPHDYEPTPGDILKLHQAQLVIYNGAGFEPWAQRVLPELQSSSTETLNASSTINLLDGNPHVWIDPVLAIQEISLIKDSLKKVDPLHTEIYEENATRYTEQLNILDQEISDALGKCTNRTIVTAHDAFPYFAKRYSLQVVSIAGLSPEEEPSPAKLAEVSTFAKNHDIKYIFFESLVSPRLSETIAQEVGAQTLVFSPIEGLTPAEMEQGKNYLSVQRDNLKNLQIALDCQ